ncbi:hypothetical protein [Bartonella sp. AC331YNZD]|uniref:hypothetical protein n=1 Tax=Bartonella sp. AC331YNZD TaxID=3243454 RepID=UPI0035D13188
MVDIINDEEEDENDIDEDAEVFDDEEERKRGKALINLERQAKRLGVSFDAAKAIKSGMNVEKAKNVVLTAAVSKNSSLKLSPTVPHSDGTSKAKIHTKWETAWRAIK